MRIWMISPGQTVLLADMYIIYIAHITLHVIIYTHVAVCSDYSYAGISSCCNISIEYFDFIKLLYYYT